MEDETRDGILAAIETGLLDWSDLDAYDAWRRERDEEGDEE